MKKFYQQHCSAHSGLFLPLFSLKPVSPQKRQRLPISACVLMSL
ncbi:MAG: hypothetical protein ACI9SB_000892, partial [Candidatus Azotimanducaceae bacterium]